LGLVKEVFLNHKRHLSAPGRQKAQKHEESQKVDLPAWRRQVSFVVIISFIFLETLCINNQPFYKSKIH